MLFASTRRSNSSLERYRKPLGEMLEAAGRLAADGVHLLDLTLGEDPYYVEPAGFHRLLELVSALKETTGLPIMVSPGVLSAEQLVRLREGRGGLVRLLSGDAQPGFVHAFASGAGL
ncbi:hypothetical protein [Bilophila wadsworthia]|uniref:hypothetical protein n=1 Tax=Bilophila wadsworthia TaxID=35833 RepID=UPI00352146CF